MGVQITQIAATVPFDNSTNGFASDNVQSAIEEIAAISGSSTEEFSHSTLDTNLIIKAKRQMIVYQELEIELGYTLDLLGELVLIE